MIKGSRGLRADGWSGDVFIGGVLYDMMVVVNDYSLCWFLGDCHLLSAVSRGLNWRGDMGSPKKFKKYQYFSNDKKTRQRTCGVEIQTNENISPSAEACV